MENVRVSSERGVTCLVSGGHFLSHLYLLAFPPLFPILVGEFHVDITSLGLSVSLIYLAQFLFQIPAGELVDRIGGKLVLVGGLFVTSGSIVLVGFADSYPWFLFFAFLTGIGQSPFHPADYALLDAAGDESSEGKRFSIHSFGGFVGFAAAPIVVSGLAESTNWHIALFSIGTVGVLYAVLLAIGLAPIHQRKLGKATSASTDGTGDSPFATIALLKRPLIAGMFLFFLVVTVADTAIQTFTTAFAVNGLGFSAGIGNTALTVFLGVTAISVLVGGWLADRFDTFKIIGCGLVWSALILWAGLSTDLTQISIIAIWGAAGFGFGIVLPARDRITNTLSTAGTTGASFGIVYTGLPIGGVLGPIVIGWVIDSSNTTVGIAASGLCFLLAAALIFLLLAYRRIRVPSKLDSSPSD